jgi:hypothetical protein
VVVGDGGGGGGGGGGGSSRTGVSGGGSSPQASGSRSRCSTWSPSSSEADEAAEQERERLRRSASSMGPGVGGGGWKRLARADGGCSSGGDGAGRAGLPPWRHSRSGHDEADTGHGEDGGGDADDWDSESSADWADSDGSAGMPPDFDSDEPGGAADSPSGCAGGIGVSEDGTESYTVLPWPAAGGFDGRPARSSGGAGAVAEEWAGFPGPLPPVEPPVTTRTVRVVGVGASDPMGLDDAEWAAMLPPLPAAGRADSDTE